MPDPHLPADTVIEAALCAEPKFRWQTSDSAHAFAALSLTDLDGTRVLSQTTTWLTDPPASHSGAPDDD